MQPVRHHPLVPHVVRFVIFLGAAAYVLWASLAPTRDLPKVSMWDKAEHAIAYFGLAFLGVWALPERRLMIAGALLAFGIGIEFAQANMGMGRMGDPLDALANTIGVTGGLLVALGARALLYRLVPPPPAGNQNP